MCLPLETGMSLMSLFLTNTVRMKKFMHTVYNDVALLSVKIIRLWSKNELQDIKKYQRRKRDCESDPVFFMSINFLIQFQFLSCQIKIDFLTAVIIDTVFHLL